MQTRTLTAATMLAVAFSACSQPAEQATQSGRAARPKQELALSSSQSSSAVVSPIEVARPGANEAAPRKTMASRKRATRPAVHVPDELPNVDTRIHTSPATVAMSPATTDIPAMELPAATGPNAGPADEATIGREGRGEPGGGLPGIIIRGGGSGRDPCDLHDPLGGGRNGPTVLVNPRIPGMPMPRGGGERVPSGPSRGNGGGIRF